MYLQKNYKIFLFLFFAIILPVHSSNTLILTNETEGKNLAKKLWYLFLPNQLSYYEVIDKNSSFVPIREKKNFGYSDNSIWLRFRIQNNSNTASWVLYPSVATLDYIELFDSAKIVSPLIGDRYSERFQYPNSRQPYFHLNLKANETRLFYIRIQSSGLLFVDFHLQRATSFFHQSNEEKFFYGLYFGFLLSLAIFMFLFFLTNKTKSFLFYSQFILSFGMINFILTGHAYHFFYNSFIANELLLLSSLSAILFFLLITSNLFRLDQKNSSLLSFFYLLKISVLVLLPFTFWWHYSKVGMTITVIMFLSIALVFFTSLKFFNQQKLFVSLFLFSSFILFFSITGHILYFDNLYSFFVAFKDKSEVISLVGFAFLTFALLLKEKQTNERKALRELKNTLSKQESQLYKEQTGKQNVQNIAHLLHKKTPVENFANQNKIEIVPTFFSASSPRRDFYDVYQFEPNLYRFFLADFMSSKSQAVLASLAIQTEYQSLKDIQHLDILTQKLNNNFIEKFSHLNIFFSILLLEVDLEKNKIIYVSVGHPQQIVVDESQSYFLEHSAGHIGFSKKTEFHTKEFFFKKDSRIFLFTNGILQEQNDKQEVFGTSRLYQSFKNFLNLSLQEHIEKIFSNVKEFTQNKNFQNDIILIAFDINKSHENS